MFWCAFYFLFLFVVYMFEVFVLLLLLLFFWDDASILLDYENSVIMLVN